MRLVQWLRHSVLMLILAAATASCGPDERAIWLAGLGGEAFPLLPKNMTSDEPAPAILPRNGQEFHILTDRGEAMTASVSSVATEPDNCMNATQFISEAGWVNERFFLASSRPILTARAAALPPGTKGISAGLVRYLQLRGIAAPNVTITQILQADLDGKSDVIVVAEWTADLGTDLAAPGDFSIVAVGELAAGNYTITDAIGAVVPDDMTDSLPQTTYLLALPDFDGDGAFEIATSEIGYEWVSVHIHALKHGALEEIATASCGS